MNEMDKEEREYLARELLGNRLFIETFEKLEREAVNRAVAAPLTDHSAQQAELAYVRAIRTFRRDCEAILRNNPPPKAAPA